MDNKLPGIEDFKDFFPGFQEKLDEMEKEKRATKLMDALKTKLIEKNIPLELLDRRQRQRNNLKEYFQNLNQNK